MRALLMLSMLGAACAAGALQAESAGKNTTTVVIGDGPFAGTYAVDNGGCVYIKQNDLLGVTFKKFAHNPSAKTLEEAAIGVNRVSAHGVTGDVVVKFLDVGSDKPQDFSVSGVPVTMVRSGKGAQFSFEGKTSGRVHLRVTATCDHTEEY